MKWDEWRFSARLAWQDHFVRWTTLGTAIFCCVITGFVLWKLLPIGLRSGVLTFHYTIYLGIDDVRAWPWIFYPLGTMFGVFLLNLLISLGVFRQDELAARALVGLAGGIAVIWGVGMVFLTRVNS